MAKRGKRKVTEGVVYIYATFNNTIVTISNSSGDVICNSSAGRCGFKGSRKGTPYAAQLAAETAIKIAMENYDFKRADVHVCGPGAGRDSALRALHSAGLEIKSLTDTTPIPHNGCRPPKKRRV